MESTAAKRREPILNLPLVVGIIVAVLFAIHLGRILLPEPIDDYVIGLFAFARALFRRAGRLRALAGRAPGGDLVSLHLMRCCTMIFYI